MTTTSTSGTAMSALTERVGDAERDALVSELTGHHVHGRLSADELDRRHGLALAAVTRYDLLVLVNDLPRADLPASRPSPTPRVRTAAKVAATRLGVLALYLTPVTATATWLGAATYDAEVGFLGGLAAGAVGYATHAVQVHLRRDRHRE